MFDYKDVLRYAMIVLVHPAWAYMLQDGVASVWGTLVFSLALVCPGYCVARWLDVCAFRTRGLREQMAWSVALSFGLTLPLVLVVWVGRVLAGECVLLAAGVGAAVMFVRHRPVQDVTAREMRWVAAVAAAWLVVVVGSLIDVGISGRLAMNVASYDHGLRTAFVDAVMRTGVPPVDPLYWAGHNAPLRYYYFWYVTCGVVARVAHISARQAFVASCVWPAAGVVAMLALFGRHLLAWRGEVLRRRVWIASALMVVTGLDLVVIACTWLGGTPIYGDMEWWARDQVASWVDTFLWVPHHAAALICCMLFLLLVWLASEEADARRRLKLAALAGLAFGSAFGLSTYVAFAAAVMTAIWLVWRLRFADRARAVGALCVAAVVAVVTLLPYLMQLLHHAPGEKSASHVLGFGVRQILDPAALLDVAPLHGLAATHPFLATQIASAVLLLGGYPAELGFFLVALWLVWRARKQQSSGERVLLVWTWSGLAATTFIRSQLIATNDYGIRSALIPQFFLLLLGVLAWERSAGWSRKLLAGLAVVGVCGSAYQVVMLRTFLPWHEKLGDAAISDLAERNYVLRDTYAAMKGRVPENARLQFDISDGGYFAQAQMLNIHRATVDEERGCNVSFGGEAAACAGIEDVVNQLFPRAGHPVPTGEEARSLCGRIGVQYLVVTRWDAAWAAQNGWVWQLPVTVERPGARIVACGEVSD